MLIWGKSRVLPLGICKDNFLKEIKVDISSDLKYVEELVTTRFTPLHPLGDLIYKIE